MELENGTVMMSIPASELPCVTMTALQLNGVFEAAQQAAEDYLNEIRQQTERAAP